MKYWPIIDNSDSEVLVLVYTKDPTYPEKTWFSQYNKYTGEEPNVDVDPKLGQGSAIMNLQDLKIDEISRVEVEYYYQISFGETYTNRHNVNDKRRIYQP